MDYEQGLEQLKQLLRGTDCEQEFQIYEARLRENLYREQLYGTSEQYRSERAQIVGQLNRLVGQVDTSFNFNDLCRQTVRKRRVALVSIGLLIALLLGGSITVGAHLMLSYTSSFDAENATATAVQHSAPVSVIVYANQGWQNTPLNVSPGEKFNIHVSGSWTYWEGTIPYLSSAGNPNYTCGHTENPNRCGEPAPLLPEGRLIAKVQPGNGEVYDFGYRQDFSWNANQYGTLQLGINDTQCQTCLSDDSGTMDVTFTIGGSPPD